MKGSRGGHGIASSIVIINHESPSLSSSIISVIPMVVVTVRRLMLVMIMVVSPLQFGLKRRCPALRRQPLTLPLWLFVYGAKLYQPFTRVLWSCF